MKGGIVYCTSRETSYRMFLHRGVDVKVHLRVVFNVTDWFTRDFCHRKCYPILIESYTLLRGSFIHSKGLSHTLKPILTWLKDSYWVSINKNVTKFFNTQRVDHVYNSNESRSFTDPKIFMLNFLTTTTIPSFT